MRHLLRPSTSAITQPSIHENSETDVDKTTAPTGTNSDLLEKIASLIINNLQINMEYKFQETEWSIDSNIEFKFRQGKENISAKLQLNENITEKNLAEIKMLIENFKESMMTQIHFIETQLSETITEVEIAVLKTNNKIRHFGRQTGKNIIP